MATIRRVNTIKVQFEASAPRPTAMELHVWIQQTLNINTDQVDMLQLNMQEKSLYIKVISPTVYEKIVQKHEGETKFKYGNGEQKQIKISKADSPAITVRVFNLPPEVPNSMVTTALTRYGVIHSVRNDQWSTAFPFPVNNGIRALKMEVKQNIPGSMPIAGYNAHVACIGQPILCFVCHEPDHKKEDCPRRKTTLPVSVQSRKLLLSDIVMGRSPQGPSTSKEERTMTQPVERDAPVKDDTDTSSETAKVTNVVTDRTEQPTLETTDRTEDTTAEEVNTDGRNAAPELMETTVIPPESKSPSQFGEASLEVSRTLQVEEPTETPSKKLKPTTQQENSRDPRLRSRDAGPSNAATDKNSPHVNPSSKTKNSPTRPHPYAIYMDVPKRAARKRGPCPDDTRRRALCAIPPGKKKRKSRIKYIEQLRTAEGKIANTSKECIKEVEEFFTSLYAASPTSQKATADILKSVNRHLSLQQQQDLQSPITEEEIRLALEGAPKNTAPGPDGLTYQVYKNHWRLIKEYLIELMNYILDTGSVIDGFSDGVVTLIPKTTHPTTVSEYRPITLLNTDYKLFMKVLANRLKPAFRNIFEIGQTCGVPEKSIIHNLATIRDTVLYFEEHYDDK
ncbi:hypothetical protein ANN_09542 [Periplaneta americana]|uniref:CCHC-type domain-containing protein n=1 Tax=Periplaneta americana TaxID=6978 RepID=A0ABQ8TLM7_PERAM|nr:hypothetical protein ANN_09542 [Periplaneta americana]